MESQRPETTQTQGTTEQQLEGNKNKKKNNCMDISSDKQANSHTRRLGHWLRKGDLKKETESLQIAAQNNSIKTNFIKAKNR